jgi:uncharacterized membrane protein
VAPSLSTAALVAVVVLSNVAGNLLLGIGMKSPAGMLSPYVPAGVALLILWTLSRMSLLSRADLTFVLPVTALGYPLSAFAGKLFLQEQVDAKRWLGTVLIVAGTILVGLMTPRSTTK